MSYSDTPPPPPPPPGDGGPGGPAYGGGYGGYAQPKNSGKAITALVLGIISIVPCCSVGVIPGVIAIVLGNSSKGEIAASNGALTGGGMAKAGVICGTVGTVLFVLYWLLVVVGIVSSPSGSFSTSP